MNPTLTTVRLLNQATTRYGKWHDLRQGRKATYEWLVDTLDRTAHELAEAGQEIERLVRMNGELADGILQIADKADMTRRENEALSKLLEQYRAKEHLDDAIRARDSRDSRGRFSK